MSSEFRVIWSASTNLSFQGHSDWIPMDDWGETEEEVEGALVSGGYIPEGLELVINASGLEWSIEFR